MADDIIIKNAVPKQNTVKYIVKGNIATLAEIGIYQAGVNASNARGGGVNRDKELYKSSLGTPVFGDLTIPSFEYTVNNVTFNVPEIKLATVLMTVGFQKNIVKTPIQGLDGTIKEYISSGDNVVNIKGKITGKNGVHPYQLVNDLKKLVDAPVAFKVVSRWLQNLDIDTLIIEGADIPQLEGGYSYQEFELNCSTDFPIELNIVSSSNTTTLTNTGASF